MSPIREEPQAAATGSGGRPLRADARRNRARVLEAAREAFATEGLAVPVDEIARRAGVGAGTVYRHFPTKESLFEAVVTDRIEALNTVGREAVRSVANGSDPGVEFFDFLLDLVSDAGTKMDLADALVGAGIDLHQVTQDAAGELHSLLDELLTQAQQVGAVRSDVDIADLHALTVGAVAAERRSTADAEPGRLTRIICDGLRPPQP